MSGVIVLGTGGHAKVVADIFDELGLEVQGFLDDDPSRHGTEFVGRPVLGPIDGWRFLSPIGIAIGIGANGVRRDLLERFPEAPWIAAVHPSAIVAASAEIGAATMVGAGAVIGPDAQIGRGAIINTRASVDHDCVVGDFAHVAVGATLAGTVTIGPGAMVGAGAVVIQNLSVGAWATVGAGAVVVRDVDAGTLVVGVPARIRER